MFGSPGVGKTMLANAITSILPPLTKREQMEVAKIYSIAGLRKEMETLDIPFQGSPSYHNKVCTDWWWERNNFRRNNFSS